MNYEIALLSAGFALLGVVVSRLLDLLGLSFSHKKEKDKIRTEKYEKMANLVDDTIQWLQRIGDAKSPKEIMHEQTCSSARQLVVLCLLYFPKLKDAAIDYLNCLTSYRIFLIDNFVEEIPHSYATQAAKNNQKEYLELAQELMKFRNKLDSEIERLAAKYAKM